MTTTSRKIKDYEIVSHGCMYSDYFQGCGLAFSDYVDVATGIGANEKEAYNDAIEQLAQNDWDVDALPSRPRGICSRPNVPAKSEDCWYYVSVRVR